MEWDGKIHPVVVVGGGIHGVLHSAGLVAGGHLSPDELLILDPHPRLLDQWKGRVGRTKMKVLRSSLSHGVEPDFHSMARFMASRSMGLEQLAQPYFRPSTELFHLHSDYLVSQYKLEASHRMVWVQEIKPEQDHTWILTCSDGRDIRARAVILCLGWTRVKPAPSWTGDLYGSRVQLLLEEDGESVPSDAPLGILGSGLSGVYLAIERAKVSDLPVHHLFRNPPKAYRFDFNPCYVGPKCLDGYRSLRGTANRWEELRENRYSGTVPPEVFEEYRALVDRGAIVQIPLGHNGEAAPEPRAGEWLIVAIGLEAQVQLTPLLGQVVKDLGAPHYRGLPVLDSQLQWLPGLWVSGPLAQLELGPASPNIIGAHLAHRIIVPSLKQRRVI